MWSNFIRGKYKLIHTAFFFHQFTVPLSRENKQQEPYHFIGTVLKWYQLVYRMFLVKFDPRSML